MPVPSPSTGRVRRVLRTTGLAAGLLAIAAGATWWFGPWSAPFRYSRTDLVTLRRIVDAHPNDFAAWREMGLRLAREGDGAMARPALQQAFALNPADPEVATGLGEILYLSERYGEAYQVLTAAVNHHPDYVLAHMALGRIYKRKASYHHAVSEFEAVVARDPGFSDAWYELAICYLEEQQAQKASQAIQHALESHPDEPHYLTVKGNVCAAVGQVDEAITATARAADLAPRDTRIQVTYANLLIAHYRGPQDLDRAEAVVRRIAELSPSYVMLPYLRGQIERFHGNWRAAVGHLEEAVAAAPTVDEVYYALGQVYVRLGRRQDAQKVLAVYYKRQELRRQVTNIGIRLGGGESKNLSLHVQLVDLRLKLGEVDAARESLETAMDIDPKAPVLQPWIRELRPRSRAGAALP